MTTPSEYLKEIGAALDQLHENFTQEDLVKLLNTTRIKLVGVMARMERFHMVEQIPGRGKRPRYYRIIVPSVEEAYTEGKLEDFYGAAGDPPPEAKRSYLRKAKGNGTETEPEPVDDTIEIDPFDVFEQMAPDDFGQLVSFFIKKKEAEIEPLRCEIISLKDNLRFTSGQKVQVERELNDKLTTLRAELATVREQYLELQTELSREKGLRAVPEQNIRTLLIRENKDNPQRQTGSSGGIGRGMSGSSHAVIVHKKPHNEHVPAAAMKNLVKVRS